MSKKEYIELLKECGMCTKKWTIARRKQLQKLIKVYMEQRKRK